MGESLNLATEYKENITFPTEKIELDIANYCLQIRGTRLEVSSEFSAAYPAVSMIKGDRTHKNWGGKEIKGLMKYGGWQSSGSGEETIEILFGVARNINRLEIFCYPENTLWGNLGYPTGIKNMTIQYWDIDAGEYVDWENLQFDEIEQEQNNPFYFGSAYFGDVYYSEFYWGGSKTGTAIQNGELMNYNRSYLVLLDRAGIKTTKIKLLLHDPQEAGETYKICAIETYETQDITKWVNNWSTNKRKDIQFNRYVMAQVDFSLLNFDKRFSQTYAPLASESGADVDRYFNAEIRPNMRVRIYAGLDKLGYKKYLNEGTYYVSTWELDSKSKMVRVMAKDRLKYLADKDIAIDEILHEKTVEELLELIAMQGNISADEMIFDPTYTPIQYFFPEAGLKCWAEMQIIAEALANIMLFINKENKLEYRVYLDRIPGEWLLNTKTGFEAGTVVYGDLEFTDDDTIKATGQKVEANLLGGTSPDSRTWISDLTTMPAIELQYWRFQFAAQNAWQYSTFVRFYRAGFGYTPYYIIGNNVYLKNKIPVEYWAQTFDAVQFKTYRNIIVTPGALQFIRIITLAYMSKYISPARDLLAKPATFDNFQVIEIKQSGTQIFYYTQTSDDGITWDAECIVQNSKIMSKLKRYIRWVAYFQMDYTFSPGGDNFTAEVRSVIIYYTITGKTKLTGKEIYDFKYNETLFDLGLTLADEFGGENELFTKIIVNANPYFLRSTQVIWEAEVPFDIEIGALVQFDIALESACDTGVNMKLTMNGVEYTGGIVEDANMIFNFTKHPTQPVVKIQAKIKITVTELFLSAQPYLQIGTIQAIAEADSYEKDLYGERDYTYENKYVSVKAIAAIIANDILARYRKPKNYLNKSIPIQFCPFIALGDVVRIQEILNSSVDLLFEIIGYTHSGSGKGAKTEIQAAELIELSEYFGPAYYSEFYWGEIYFGGRKYGV